MSARRSIVNFSSVDIRAAPSSRTSFILHPQQAHSQQTSSHSSIKSFTSSTSTRKQTHDHQPAKDKMVTGALGEMLARNKKFSESYKPPPPLMEMAKGMRATGAGVVVLSCSDPRLNPYAVLGVDGTTDKATMVRNAGGRAFDAIRTLSVLQTIGAPGTIVVMHHTDCGMTHFHDHAIKEALTEIAPEEKTIIEGSMFGEIRGSIEESVREDLALIRASPLIKKTTQLVGLKYDINTGVLIQVEETKSEL